MQLNMSPEQIKFTDADIAYTESILLPKGNSFDSERRTFIRNLETIDLQAAPGSGKTTVLLAKLLLLEKYLPFPDNSGILVLSHTNSAVDKIERNIQKYCPKIFSTYPSFVGTIQTFVDTFLAIPYYSSIYHNRPDRIDSEIYDEKVLNYYAASPDTGFKNWVDKKSVEYLLKIRFDSDWNLIPGMNRTSKDLKLGGGTHAYKAIVKMKRLLLEWGYLHFDDAYFLASRYLKIYPDMKEVLQRRFRFVFVDEMQDMDVHQYNLLENIFYSNGKSLSKYQRIGDKNQAIFSGEIKLDRIWSDRDRRLTLKGSHRFSQNIADAVRYFGLDFLEIQGLNRTTNIKPYILLFDDPKTVLPKFVDLIKEHNLTDNVYPFCALGWRTEHEDPTCLGIKNYCPTFTKEGAKTKIDFSNLRMYLVCYDNRNNASLDPIRKNILNSLLKVLRIQDITDNNARCYTKRHLLDYLRQYFPKEHDELNLNLFEWSFAIRKGNVDTTYHNIQEYIPRFLYNVFGVHNVRLGTQNFLTDTSIPTQFNDASTILCKCLDNIYENNGITVRLSTVHSAKGHTHTATLYMETFYYKDGGGDNAKSYESQRLEAQLKGEKLASTSGVRVRQSARVAYVGLSRPSDLLCLAVHKDRLPTGFQSNFWEIVRI